jgi:WD40 repeat protein
MASLFLSHSSEDRVIAERTAAQLERAGYTALFLDSDPDHGLVAGQEWERRLYRQLRAADGLIFLGSPSAVASRWCAIEIGITRSLGKPIFPILVAATGRHPLLDDVQWVDATSDTERAHHQLLDGLRQAGFDPEDVFDWDPSRSPYPGLGHFDPDDAAVFFGRDTEIDQLVALLQPTIQHPTGRFVAIVGPSGSGKSSLLHAGLLPRLQRAAPRRVVLPSLTPGRSPTRRLAASLAEAYAKRGIPASTAQLLRSLDRSPEGLDVLVGDLTLGFREQPQVILPIDQAEELSTLSGPREQQSFLNLLRGAREGDSNLWVVATLRSEFLSTAPDRAGLAEIIDDAVVVEPVSRGRLSDVVLRPAERAGLVFAPGLAQRLVEDAKGGDALPLLAYVLRELYERAGRGGRVKSADYELLGGVIGALQRRADAILAELKRTGHDEDLVLATLLRLAAVDGDAEPSRRRLRLDALTPGQVVVVRAFVDARLLTSNREAYQEPTVEVAHEALLRQWSPLRNAVEAERQSLRMHTEIERVAADWEHSGHDQSYLLSGGRLASFERWANSHPSQLEPREQKFLAASQELVELERRLVLSRQMAVHANRLVDTRPETALLAGLQSLSLARDTPAHDQPPEGLVAALARLTHASTVFAGHLKAVRDIALSPDGSRLATASEDQTVRVWDPRGGRELCPPLSGHSDVVHAVAFNADGNLLVSAGGDGVLQLWDVDHPDAPLRTLQGHAQAIWGVAFSPDGRLIASASADKTVRFWDADTGAPYGNPLVGHDNTVYGVAFHPSGDLIATGSWDYTVRMWSVRTQLIVGEPLLGHTFEVQNVVFSPDGALLASASADKTVRLWDVPSGSSHGDPLVGHADGVHGVAFSPDGNTLATASGDRTVRLWRVASGTPLDQPLVGHRGQVRNVAFTPDGNRLATGSWDATARLWEVTPRYSICTVLAGQSDYIGGIAINRAGTLLAASSGNGAVRFWYLPSGSLRDRALLGHSGDVYGVAFSPDGRLLASAGRDGTIRLWDVESGDAHGQPLMGSDDQAWDVAFSPDGKLLASGGWDDKVRLWDVRTGEQIGPPLVGHLNDVNGVAFSPDGTLIASAGTDQTIRLWDVMRHEQYGQPLTGHVNYVYGVAFSPDGRMLASASEDGTARIWDLTAGPASSRSITGHADSVYAVAFSPDGRTLATASADRTVRLWNVESGDQLGFTLSGHAARVYDVAFHPNGMVASAGEDKTVRIWRLDFSDWVASACAVASRNLSQDEWDEVARGLPYERTCPRLPSGPGARAGSPAATYQRTPPA